MQKQLEINYGCELLLEDINYKRNITECVILARYFSQGHPTDYFGRISVRKTCNRLKLSVREMSSRAFLVKIN